MTLNFTEKAATVLSQAQSTAKTRQHVSITPIHLSLALLQADPDHFLKNILDQCGSSSSKFESNCLVILSKMPTQSPCPEPGFSPLLAQILKSANEKAIAQKDEFIAIDHLILALLESKEFSQDLIKEPQLLNAVKSKIQSLRSSRKVVSPTSDENYQALSKYAIDLVAQAEQGKLDPCIGRDDGIRRLIRVLW